MSDDLSHFRIGMNGDVTIETGISYNALTIPLEAITERDGKVFVEVKTDEDTTEEREIELGLEAENRVEATRGLNESDQVLIP
jgi:HlyD family secretion protein